MPGRFIHSTVYLAVFLVIIAEAYLDGRKVLPHIIVLFSLYNVHANKKALVQKEKSRFLMSCKAHKKTKKPVNIQERRFGFWCLAEQKGVGNTIARGGVLKYNLGGYVPPGSPKQDPVLERFCIQNDTPF